LGISGPSGSGKTSLARIMARLVAPNAGTVRLGGVDLARLAEASLRRHIGLLAQPTELIAGTLRENLSLYRPEAEEQEMKDVLVALGLDGFAAGLPQGLDTPLGEDAGQTSSGQRLRIGIARVLLLMPPMAILDEPTASLDDESAGKVLVALASFARGRSLCLISHDPRVLALCDEVIALREGQVDRRGAPKVRALASARRSEIA
jgi:ABC-type bacteriocin/lantibiotic exporter with double-glycine peptidase domain